MNADLENAQNRIVAQLRQGLNPDAIYLFGSHARGDAGAGSDLDFLVVVRESDKPRSKRARDARKVVTDRSVAKDILVMTQDEWKRGLQVVASLPATVVREGKLLYER
jgi:predicted nucleotidyltransferase